MTKGLVTPLADATFHRCPLQALRGRHTQTLGALSLLVGGGSMQGRLHCPLLGRWEFRSPGDTWELDTG